MSFYDTCVAPRNRNGPSGCRRLTGSETFELEGMDPCDIDIDTFGLMGADGKGPESVPIAMHDQVRFEMRWKYGAKPDGSLEPARFMT